MQAYFFGSEVARLFHGSWVGKLVTLTFVCGNIVTIIDRKLFECHVTVVGLFES